MLYEHVGLVAYDKSPSDALWKLGDALEKTGCRVTRYLGGGKLDVPVGTIEQTIGSMISLHPPASLVLIGMSSKPELSVHELAAADAATVAGIPYGFFSDTFYNYRWPWFANYREGASYLLISSSTELSDAVALFPNAKVSVTGNPSWEGSGKWRYSRDVTLQRLGGPSKQIILVPFNKGHEGNLHLVQAVFSAFLMDMEADIVLAPHPGELKQDPGAFERYRSEIRAMPFTAWFRLVHPDELESSDILQVASAVISASSPTTDTKAVLLRTPVINYTGGEHTSSRLKTTVSTGIPPLVELGAAALARTPEEIRELYLNRKNEIIAGQTRVFSGPPPVGQFIARAMDLLED